MIAMRGAKGEIRRGYKVVATLGKWELAPRADLGGRLLTADVADPDPVWYDPEGPHDVVLQMPTRTWKWRNVNPMSEGRWLLTTQAEVS